MGSSLSPLSLASSLFVLAADAPGSGSSVALDLLRILAAAALVALVLRRLRLPLIPCYLITGAIIGPGLTGLIGSDESISSISGLAMVMLMFTIGLHLDPSSIGSGALRSLGVGAVSTLLVVAVIWYPATLLAGAWPPGLAIAMAVSMSSTAVVLQLLQANREMQRLSGRLCVAISITQDLLSLVFLAVLPVLGRMMTGAVLPDVAGPAAGEAAGAVTSAASAGAHHGAKFFPAEWPAWLSGTAGLVGIAGIIVISRRLLPALLKEASRGAVSELPLVLAAGSALTTAVAAAGLGFSAELGAFIAGFVLAGTPFRHQLAGQLSPMRDLFMAVFFTSVGLKLHILGLGPQLHIVLAGVLLVLIIKTVAIGVSIWFAGATSAVALAVALTLSQAGEFTIVILSAAEDAGVVGKEATSLVIAVVVVTLMLTPSLYSLGKRLRPLAAKLGACPFGMDSRGPLREVAADPDALAASAEVGGAAGEPAPTPATDRPELLANFVIIAGFGVVGRSLADRLDLQHVPFCVVDMNRQTVETQRKLKRRAVYGDVSNPEVLESAGLEHADAVVLTIPDDDATLRACGVIRNARPDIFISARTSFLSKAFAAQSLGADHVVVEEVATAEMMAREVMQRLERRRQDRKRGT